MSVVGIIKKLLNRVSPIWLVSFEYYHAFGRKINWKNPKDLNEKINWLKFYSDTSEWTRLADKYAVRDYVKSCGFEDCLVKLYGVWDSVDKIKWNDLPSSFVLKVNNGSGNVLICKDKRSLDVDSETTRFRELLKGNYGGFNGELHYKLMPPKIIAEELLDVTKQPINTDTLIDYKIWCFDGKPYCIWACFNRHKDSVEVSVYDLKWNRHDEYSVFTNHYKKASLNLPKPISLEKMLLIAKSLSKGFPQVRIDLYEVDGKPYFGEMTFTSAGGFNNFYTEDFLVEMGEQIDLRNARAKVIH